MKRTEPLSADQANEYATWFAALGDGTRILILHLVATSDRPVTVGEVVEAVGKSQSTVSVHVRRLVDEGYLFAEPDGVRTLLTANALCLTALPEAAARIMGIEIMGVDP